MNAEGPHGNSSSIWKIELRIRYIPKSIEEFIEHDSELFLSFSVQPSEQRIV
jgi:hypothetical protein